VTASALDLDFAQQSAAIERVGECRLLAQSGHHNTLNQCPLLGVKRTFASVRNAPKPDESAVSLPVYRKPEVKRIVDSHCSKKINLVAKPLRSLAPQKIDRL